MHSPELLEPGRDILERVRFQLLFTERRTECILQSGDFGFDSVADQADCAAIRRYEIFSFLAHGAKAEITENGTRKEDQEDGEEENLCSRRYVLQQADHLDGKLLTHMFNCCYKM